MIFIHTWLYLTTKKYNFQRAYISAGTGFFLYAYIKKKKQRAAFRLHAQKKLESYFQSNALITNAILLSRLYLGGIFNQAQKLNR